MLNRFESPLGEGFYRALITAIVTLASVTLMTFQGAATVDPNGIAIPEQDRWKAALIAGAIAALAPFVSQGAMAVSDQGRADKGEVKPADVPEAAARP